MLSFSWAILFSNLVDPLGCKKTVTCEPRIFDGSLEGSCYGLVYSPIDHYVGWHIVDVSDNFKLGCKTKEGTVKRKKGGTGLSQIGEKDEIDGWEMMTFYIHCT